MSFRYPVLGALLGFLLGIVGPIATSAYLQHQDINTPDAGAGTFFALAIIVTAPVGAAVGGIAGLIYGRFKDN